MVVLRYWQLFHNEQHTDLRGKEARVQVLKYYNRDISKEVKGTDNCDEEQTQQTRSTHNGLSSRLFRRCLRKRLQSKVVTEFISFLVCVNFTKIYDYLYFH